MNDLIVVPQTNQWRKLKALVLDSVSSPITKRVYNLGLDEFFGWLSVQEPRPGFTKATVSSWRVALEARGLGAVSINVRITAVRSWRGSCRQRVAGAGAGQRHYACEGRGIQGRPLGELAFAQAGAGAPERAGYRHREGHAPTAPLSRCSWAAGLRRSEVAALTTEHIQQRDGRWCIVDLFGKHGRVRTVPMPVWVKVAIDAWTALVNVSSGYVFRPVNRGDQTVGERLSGKVVWQLLRPYASAAGVPGIAPHDCRRTAAKLCRAAGGELEQIQLLLGHASVQTTERYLGTKQDLVNAPNDGIKLRLAM